MESLVLLTIEMQPGQASDNKLNGSSESTQAL